MKYIIIIILIFFVNNAFSKTDVDDQKLIKQKRKFTSLIFFSLGMPFSSGSKDFFNNYDKFFKGYKKDFKLLPTIIAGTKLRFDNNYRIGVQFLYQKTNLRDIYSEIVDEVDNSGYREYSQIFDISDIPIFLTAEYLPYTSQFRTYVGGGLGFLIRNIKWNERINSSIILDKRKGGLNFNSTDVFTCLKIYSGLELGFDKMSEYTFLGSLVFEVSYNYTIAKSEIYKSVKNQFFSEKNELNNKVNILPGYFIFSVALTFNFNKLENY